MNVNSTRLRLICRVFTVTMVIALSMLSQAYAQGISITEGANGVPANNSVKIGLKCDRNSLISVNELLRVTN